MNDMVKQQQLVIQMQKNKDFKETLSSAQFTDWFMKSPERYYRRLYAQHSLTNTVGELKDIATDALSSQTEFAYKIKGDKSDREDEKDPEEEALVMVSGDIKAQQKLSARSIKKVQKVIQISKQRNDQLDEAKKLITPFVDIKITNNVGRKRR